MNTGPREKSFKIKVFHKKRLCGHAFEYLLDATRQEINEEIKNLAVDRTKCFICDFLGKSTVCNSNEVSTMLLDSDEKIEEHTLGLRIRRVIRNEDIKEARKG